MADLTPEKLNVCGEKVLSRPSALSISSNVALLFCSDTLHPETSQTVVKLIYCHKNPASPAVFKKADSSKSSMPFSPLDREIR